MSIIKQYHKDTGITYVYESESYWDKEKKQPRSRRKLIGKLDNETGEIVPTGKKNRSHKKSNDSETTNDDLFKMEKEIERLKEYSHTLEIENTALRDTLEKIRELITTV